MLVHMCYLIKGAVTVRHEAITGQQGEYFLKPKEAIGTGIMPQKGPFLRRPTHHYYTCIIIINSPIAQEDSVMASVEERDLAGIGKRFTVKTNKGDRRIIILQDSGGV